MRTSLYLFAGFVLIYVVLTRTDLAQVPVSASSIEAPKQSDPNNAPGITNPAIDMRGFLQVANEAANYRERRRVTEEQFLEMSKEKGTIVLDTRSAAMFKLLHIEGAVHLNFSDITKDGLNKAIPDPNTRILIYCNNNFENRPVAFVYKTAPAALNIPTFITLYEYGYRNVYELGPLIDADKTILNLVSSDEESGAE